VAVLEEVSVDAVIVETAAIEEIEVVGVVAGDEVVDEEVAAAEEKRTKSGSQ